MAIWIRKINPEDKENYLKLAVDDWNLISQFEIFEKWLKTEAANLELGNEWIVDIGFSPREGALGGGPIISKEIMELCLKNNITIYLSEYGE